MIRKRFYFSGRVQGVGFRHTAKMNADIFGVTGFVQNLSDGRVLMEAQGTEGKINACVYVISDRDSFIQITDIESEEIPLIDTEKAFNYRF